MALADSRLEMRVRPAAAADAVMDVAMLGHCPGNARWDLLLESPQTVAEIARLGFAEQMETLIRRHPRDLELMIQFGRVFEINGNIERAFGAYRRALDLNLAPPPDVFLLLARTAVGLRRDAEARIYIRDFLALGGDAAAIEPWRIRIAEKPAQ